MFKYKLDLHIHTALSPCADSKMTPVNIVQTALAKGLHLIAITDHNSVANVQAIQKAATYTQLKVIPGMELQTKEDVHLICLFPDFETAQQWGDFVDKHLPPINNKPELFGEQWIMDPQGRKMAQETKLLLNSTDISVEQAVREVQQLGGVCYPAHIDRPSYGMINSLGFIPPDLAITAVEISRFTTAEEACFLFPNLKNYVLAASSDAHYLEDIGLQASVAHFQQPASFEELKLALQGAAGRKLFTKNRDLAMQLGDILQATLDSRANQITIDIDENLDQDQLLFHLKANSSGISPDIIKEVIDPFNSSSKTHRLAIGLQLLRSACTSCNGEFTMNTTEAGIVISAALQYAHPNRKPLGNITPILVDTIAKHPQLNLLYNHRVNGEKIYFNTFELRQELEDISLDNPAVLTWMTKYLASSFDQLYAKR